VVIVALAIGSYDRPSFSWEVRSVVFALVCLLLRCLVRLLAGRVGDLTSDVEVVVLRHQLMVLKRQARRPRLRRRDRLFMTAIRVLPRARWSMFVVSPRRSFDATESWCEGSGPSGVWHQYPLPVRFSVAAAKGTL
jgi:hypothetical protein